MISAEKNSEVTAQAEISGDEACRLPGERLEDSLLPSPLSQAALPPRVRLDRAQRSSVAWNDLMWRRGGRRQDGSRAAFQLRHSGF